MAKILSIKDLHVDVASTPIINGLNLENLNLVRHTPSWGQMVPVKTTLAKTNLQDIQITKFKSGKITLYGS
jgi:hypothetical protein